MKTIKEEVSHKFQNGSHDSVGFTDAGSRGWASAAGIRGTFIDVS